MILQITVQIALGSKFPPFVDKVGSAIQISLKTFHVEYLLYQFSMFLQYIQLQDIELWEPSNLFPAQIDGSLNSQVSYYSCSNPW